MPVTLIERPLLIEEEIEKLRMEERVLRQIAEARAAEALLGPKERAKLEDFRKRLPRLVGIAGAAAGAWTFTNNSRTYLLNGAFDIDSDTWKMALFLSTSNLGAATTTYAGVTNEHANANGYTTGGAAVTLTLSGTTTVTVASTNASWTASGGSITARFAVIYEVAGNVLCYCLLDSTPADVTVTSGNTLTVQINASGVFTLA